MISEQVASDKSQVTGRLRLSRKESSLLKLIFI